MNNRIKNTIWWITLILLACSILALPGCKNYDVVRVNDKYNSFVMKDGIAKFSFEYNIKYELNNVNERQTGTTIYMFGPPVGEAQDSTLIAIHILDPEAGHIGYQYYLEDLIRIDIGKPEYKIIERFPVTVSGESGEEVCFYYVNYGTNESLVAGIPPAPLLIRRVMFWHNNMLWWLEIRGLESSAEADKADFEHIIQTFKIIE